MKKISIIIAAYNEQDTISGLIHSIGKLKFSYELVIINDGSTDRTKDVILALKRLYSINDLHLPQNKGKGYAMAIGIESATGEILVFLDADISKLAEEHLMELINPLEAGVADMVLGQPTGTLIKHVINPFKSFTGQRSVYKSDIIQITEKMKDTRFGVETLINLYYNSEGKVVKNILLQGLVHPSKFEKTSQTLALKEFVLEGHQIASTAFQNYNMVSKIFKHKIQKIRIG